MTQKQGRADQIAHDYFFARAVTADMVAILRGVAVGTPDGWFTTHVFRDRVQNARTVASEILDFFDRRGVTLAGATCTGWSCSARSARCPVQSPPPSRHSWRWRLHAAGRTAFPP